VSELARHVSDVTVIDQHVHGCWLTTGDRRRFEHALSEANTEPPADFDSGFDSPIAYCCALGRAPAFIAQLLELAPFRKILYSPDGYGPAELHYLGTALWRKGIRRLLDGFVESGDWREADAIRVVHLVAHGNAGRVYGLSVKAV
jgi:predicted TIM-barrel fold metal-dependent hydrolase